MYSEIYWINADPPNMLAIMARPRAGDWLAGEIAHWKREGVGIVLSLLEPHEIDDLGLHEEASMCEQHGIQYLSFPIPDRRVPSDMAEAMSLARGLSCQDRPVAIHCRAGIGRSSIMAAAVMVSEGNQPSDALGAIAQARRLNVPDTDAQRDWVMRLQSPSSET